MASSDIAHARNIGSVKYIEWDWLSDASGDYSQQSTNAVDGVILRAVFIPDSAGTQPTDLYDVTLTDGKSVDVLQGYGANRSNSSTNNVNFGDGYQIAVDELLTLVVANAGNAKGGVVRVYYR